MGSKQRSGNGMGIQGSATHWCLFIFNRLYKQHNWVKGSWICTPTVHNISDVLFNSPLASIGRRKKEATIGLVTSGLQPDGIYIYFDGTSQQQFWFEGPYMHYLHPEQNCPHLTLSPRVHLRHYINKRLLRVDPGKCKEYSFTNYSIR